jgi:hypothetical protein
MLVNKKRDYSRIGKIFSKNRYFNLFFAPLTDYGPAGLGPDFTAIELDKSLFFI